MIHVFADCEEPTHDFSGSQFPQSMALNILYSYKHFVLRILWRFSLCFFKIIEKPFTPEDLVSKIQTRPLSTDMN